MQVSALLLGSTVRAEPLVDPISGIFRTTSAHRHGIRPGSVPQTPAIGEDMELVSPRELVERACVCSDRGSRRRWRFHSCECRGIRLGLSVPGPFMPWLLVIVHGRGGRRR